MKGSSKTKASGWSQARGGTENVHAMENVDAIEIEVTRLNELENGFNPRRT